MNISFSCDAVLSLLKKIAPGEQTWDSARDDKKHEKIEQVVSGWATNMNSEAEEEEEMSSKKIKLKKVKKSETPKKQKVCQVEELSNSNEIHQELDRRNQFKEVKHRSFSRSENSLLKTIAPKSVLSKQNNRLDSTPLSFDTTTSTREEGLSFHPKHFSESLIFLRKRSEENKERSVQAH